METTVFKATKGMDSINNLCEDLNDYFFRTELVQKLFERRMDTSLSFDDGSMEMAMPLLPANLGSLTVAKPSK